MATTGLPPRDGVFEITELMEHIVYQLQPLDVLTVKRVSKCFKDVIDGSKKIHENINFLNVKAPGDSVALNPTVFNKRRTSKTKKKDSNTLVGLGWLGGYQEIHADTLSGPIKERHIFSHDGCRSMAICTPLPKKVLVTFIVEIFDEGGTDEIILDYWYEAGDTITLGDIMDKLGDETIWVAEDGEVFVLDEESTELIIDFGDGVEVYMEGGEVVEEEEKEAVEEKDDKDGQDT